MEAELLESEWIVREVPAGFRPDEGPSGLPPILRLLLAQRGYTEADAVETFLRPKLRSLRDPFELPEMDEAVGRLLRAVDEGERICIFGDYDVDGITSITLLRHVLRGYGATPQSFIPVRGEEGYGLSDAALERCLSGGEQPSLLVTVDCGTASGPQTSTSRSDFRSTRNQ